MSLLFVALAVLLAVVAVDLQPITNHLGVYEDCRDELWGLVTVLLLPRIASLQFICVRTFAQNHYTVLLFCRLLSSRRLPVVTVVSQLISLICGIVLLSELLEAPRG